MIRGLTLWDYSQYTKHHTITVVLIVFDLLMREYTHPDVHTCQHDYQMIFIKIHVVHTDQLASKIVS